MADTQTYEVERFILDAYLPASWHGW